MSDSVIDLHYLRMFVLIVELKSSKEVAQILGVTPSAVSQGIKALEKQLGEIVLLDREARPLRPTEMGRRLYQEGRALLQSAEAVRTRMMLRDLKVSTLRLGLGETVTSTFSPWLVKSLSDKVFELHVSSDMSLPMLKHLGENKLDVAVCADASWSAQNFDRREIYREEYLLVTSKGAERVATRDALRKLSEVRPFLSYNHQSSDDIEVQRILRTLDLHPVHTVSVGASYTLVGLVSLLDGWTILPATNLWSGGKFVSDLRFSSLPVDRKPARSMFVIGNAITQGPKMDLVFKEVRKAVERHLVPELNERAAGLGKYLTLISE